MKVEYKNEDMKSRWENYPVKVMMGEYIPGKGMYGMDLCFLGENHSIFIPLDNLLKMACEMVERGMIESNPGIEIIFGTEDFINRAQMPLIEGNYFVD